METKGLDSRGRAPNFGVVGPESLLHTEDPYPSLSDYHDYEPHLEFDDTEIACANSDDVEIDLNASPVPSACSATTVTSAAAAVGAVTDGTIEENFEAELGLLSLGLDVGGADSLQQSARLAGAVEDFSDMAQHQIVDIVGDDTCGRKVIVVSACRFPDNKDFDHAKFLSYLMFTLDQYVEQDYSLVYFHYGLKNRNKPPISWLWQAYRAFDRKYKKNLKSLYLVHPTNFIRLMYGAFKPIISAKFGRKVLYVNKLEELRQHIPLEQLPIPECVLEHDRLVVARSTRLLAGTAAAAVTSPAPLSTCQFGVSLQFISDNNDGDPIAPVLRQCIEFLSAPAMLETEGLFRRSAGVKMIAALQKQFNHGETVRLADPHVAAVLVKAYLRELPDPLLTNQLYDDIIQVSSLPASEQVEAVKAIVLDKLPEHNYKVLKYLVSFLLKVIDHSDLNKMTVCNLAVVFGPNLVWQRDRQMSLAAIGPINMFAKQMFINHHLFIV